LNVASNKLFLYVENNEEWVHFLLWNISSIWYCWVLLCMYFSSYCFSVRCL